jgi:orotidine-5'-phosphate decarboxylase
LAVGPKERLIVALDVASVEEAHGIVERLGAAVVFYKIGYQLAFAGGLTFADTLIRRGKRVFLDMKLHDIGNTVSHGVESAIRLGVTFLTVHAYPQTMKAAVAARSSSPLRILAVTVLTSYDDQDLAEAGYGHSVRDLVAMRGGQARQIGVDGLVCSPLEVGGLRAAIGAGMLLVTPGIRPATGHADDQKRVMSPAQAIRSGADYLVVGRPILQAPDPKAAAEGIVSEIEAALAPVPASGIRLADKGRSPL